MPHDRLTKGDRLIRCRLIQVRLYLHIHVEQKLSTVEGNYLEIKSRLSESRFPGVRIPWILNSLESGFPEGRKLQTTSQSDWFDHLTKVIRSFLTWEGSKQFSQNRIQSGFPEGRKLQTTSQFDWFDHLTKVIRSFLTYDHRGRKQKILTKHVRNGRLVYKSGGGTGTSVPD